TTGTCVRVGDTVLFPRSINQQPNKLSARQNQSRPCQEGDKVHLDLQLRQPRLHSYTPYLRVLGEISRYFPCLTSQPVSIVFQFSDRDRRLGHRGIGQRNAPWEVISLWKKTGYPRKWLVMSSELYT